LVLEQCERKILLGWRLLVLPNRVNVFIIYIFSFFFIIITKKVLGATQMRARTAVGGSSEQA